MLSIDLRFQLMQADSAWKEPCHDFTSFTIIPLYTENLQCSKLYGAFQFNKSFGRHLLRELIALSSVACSFWTRIPLHNYDKLRLSILHIIWHCTNAINGASKILGTKNQKHHDLEVTLVTSVPDGPNRAWVKAPKPWIKAKKNDAILKPRKPRKWLDGIDWKSKYRYWYWILLNQIDAYYCIFYPRYPCTLHSKWKMLSVRFMNSNPSR